MVMDNEIYSTMGGPLFDVVRRVEAEIVKGREHEREHPAPYVLPYIRIKGYAWQGVKALGMTLWARALIALNLRDVPKKAATSEDIKELKALLTDVIQRRNEDSGRKPVKSELIAETSVRPDYYDPFIRMPNTTNV